MNVKNIDISKPFGISAKGGGALGKYYHAYNERYKRVHGLGYLWFAKAPTPEVGSWTKLMEIPRTDPILEIGCGEGRDALYLTGQGYQVTAVDASPQAIQTCQKLAQKRGLVVDWRIHDALNLSKEISTRYRWVYSVATLHMLVDDNDRDRFLRELAQMLEPGGHALLVSKGNGVIELTTDPQSAFVEEERVIPHHRVKVTVPMTSYRSVSWEYHREELSRAGLIVENQMNTENFAYQQCMTVYLRKANDRT